MLQYKPGRKLVYGREDKKQLHPSFHTHSMNKRSTSGLTILLWHMLANEEGVPGKQPLCA